MDEMKQKLQTIATNARINVDDNIINELEEIIKLFNILNEVDTENIEPSFQPIAIKDIFREDKVKESLPLKDVFLNVKNRKDDFFKGPKLL